LENEVRHLLTSTLAVAKNSHASARVGCWQASVVSTITSRVSTGRAQTGVRKQLQNCESIFMYFTASEWLHIRGTAPMASKIDLVVKRAAGLGFRNPSERSYASMALLLVNNANVSAAVALGVVRDIKRTFRSITARLALPTFSIETLPETPSEFKALHPVVHDAIYGSEMMPVAPPGQVVDWFNQIGQVPCRSTRSGCDAVRSELPGKAAAAVRTLCSASSAAFVRHGSDLGEIPITYLQPQIGNLQHGHVARQQPLLALPPPPIDAGSQSDGMRPSMSHSPHSSQSLQSIEDSKSEPSILSGCVAAANQPACQSAGVDKMILEMRRQLHQGKAAECDDAEGPAELASAKVPFKRPSAASGADPVMKRPAGASSYGCSKCRWNPSGCSRCRDPVWQEKQGKMQKKF
jgi:hypothetical protein